MISTFTVVIDANVFFGARLRSLIIQLAQTGIFRARWTAEIHREWSGAVAEKRGIDIAHLSKTIQSMNAAVPDCVVGNYETLIPSLHLPDDNDRHVLAAAITCKAGAIVTFNISDFPATDLAPYGIDAIHPDEFLLDVEDIAPHQFIAAARSDMAHYYNPPLTVDQYLDDLRRAGVAKVAEHLASRAVLLRAVPTGI